MTDISGQLTSRYFGDNVTTTRAGGSANRQRQIDIRQELLINTRSYVYHPNFVDLSVSGGPMLESSSFQINSDKTDQSAKLFSLVARADILKEKPYRGAVFFERLNPSLQVGFGETALSNNTRYGLEFSLLESASPIPIHIDMSQSKMETKGTTRIVDNQIDRLNLRASRTLGTLGSTTLRAFSTRQKSRSGNPTLPIQSTRLNSDGLELETRLRFGKNQRHELHNSITLSRDSVDLEQGMVPDRGDFRVLVDFRSRLSKYLHSFSSLNHTTSSQGDLDTTTSRFATRLSYRPDKRLFSSAGLRGEHSTSSRISTQLLGANGSVRYEHELPLGVGSFRYAASHDRLSQDSASNSLEIVDEAVVLSGLAPIALSKTRVLGGSVVISNTSRSQTFVEGFDYLLSVVGLQTRIERLSGGSILDGEQILADYSVDSGGTFTSVQTDQSFSVQWRLTKNFETGYQYTSSSPQIKSGFTTSPLNNSHSNLLSARAEYPLRGPLDMRIGGNIEHESRTATVDSFKRDTGELYMQTALPFFSAANLRIGLRRTLLNHNDPQSDSDSRALDIRFNSRHRYGINMSLDGGYEEDVRNVTPQRRIHGTLRARGGFRKFTVDGELSYVKEQQGSFDRSRLNGQLTIRRMF